MASNIIVTTITSVRIVATVYATVIVVTWWKTRQTDMDGSIRCPWLMLKREEHVIKRAKLLHFNFKRTGETYKHSVIAKTGNPRCCRKMFWRTWRYDIWTGECLLRWHMTD
jgi:hypothetical protein